MFSCTKLSGLSDEKAELSRVRKLGWLITIIAVFVWLIALTPYVAWAAGNIGGATCTEADFLAAISSGTVNFTADCTITLDPNLTQGLQIVNKNLTIKGNGFKAILDGGNARRILYITNKYTLTIDGITFTKGKIENNNGAAILVGTDASAIIVNSTFLNNSVGGSSGGAISSMSSFSLLVDNCTFVGNSAFATSSPGGFNGGAIAISGGTTVTITNNTFSNNSASNGGAIFTFGLGYLISNNLFKENSAGVGGAISVGGNGFQLISNSTFMSNTASVFGGALFIDINNPTITNSTFSGNSAPAGGAIYSYDTSVPKIRNTTISNNTAINKGGGILTKDGSLDINNSTIVSNAVQASGNGGGIALEQGSTLLIRNSILAGNFGSDFANSGSTFTSQGYNLFGTGISGATATDILNDNPKLAPLGNNGGATLTHLPDLDSPLINAGNPNPPLSGSVSCENTDQRGITRPLDSRCDIGAVELGVGATISFLPNTVRLATTIGNSKPKLVGNGNIPQINTSSAVTIKAANISGIPNNATGIVGILTNVECSSGGNLRFWAGTITPNANNLNVPGLSLSIPGATIALNLSTNFITPLDGFGNFNLGWNGQLGSTCGYALDVLAYLTVPSLSANTIALLPNTVRVATTIDGSQPKLVGNGNSPQVGTTNTVTLQVGGANNIPNNATGVVGILTNVECSSGGNLRFWVGTITPNANNLNVPGLSLSIPGATTALNLSTGFVAALDNSGKLNLGWSGKAGSTCGYVLDVVGYLVSGNVAKKLYLLPASVRVETTIGGTKPALIGNGAVPQVATSTSTTIPISGSNSIPPSASGVLGIITNVACSAGGNLRFWIGVTTPNSTNLNVPGLSLNIPGTTIALNLSTGFMTVLDGDGKVNMGWNSKVGSTCGYAIDVTGYLN